MMTERGWIDVALDVGVAVIAGALMILLALLFVLSWVVRP